VALEVAGSIPVARPKILEKLDGLYVKFSQHVEFREKSCLARQRVQAFGIARDRHFWCRWFPL